MNKRTDRRNSDNLNTPKEALPVSTPDVVQGRELAGPRDGLSVREAASEAQVHYQTIYTWIRNKQLPVTKFGPSGRLRIHPQDLADTVRSGR